MSSVGTEAILGIKLNTALTFSLVYLDPSRVRFLLLCYFVVLILETEKFSSPSFAWVFFTKYSE